MDLVGTCPKSFWSKWLEEGDCAGDPASGYYYYWNTRSRLLVANPTLIGAGDRFYVVAHNKLRGYAPVLTVIEADEPGAFIIVRKGGAVAVTIPEKIRGFQGLRKPWWPRESEIPFPGWKTP